MIQTLQSNIPIARVEYLDDISIKACCSYSKIKLADSPTLFLEFNGSTLEEVNSRAEAVRQIATSNGGSNFEWSSDLEKRKHLWKARHDLYYACLAIKPSSKALITDVCVPISKLTQMILGTKELIAKSGLIGTCVGHVGDGNFHTQIFYEQNSIEELRKAQLLEYLISMYVAFNKFSFFFFLILGPMFGHVGDGNFHTIFVFNTSDENEIKKVKLTAYQMGEYVMIWFSFQIN